MTRPGARKRHVKGAKLRREGEDGEAATYFSYVLPRILRQEAEKKVRDMGIHEVIQEPGEVIFVPGDGTMLCSTSHTVAVTQNFAPLQCFPRSGARHARAGNTCPGDGSRPLRSSAQRWPDVALKVNHDDGFEFKFSTKEKEKASVDVASTPRTRKATQDLGQLQHQQHTHNT